MQLFVDGKDILSNLNLVKVLIKQQKAVSKVANCSIASSAQANGFTHFAGCTFSDAPKDLPNQQGDFLVYTLTNVFGGAGNYQWMLWDGGKIWFRTSWLKKDLGNNEWHLMVSDKQ